MKTIRNSKYLLDELNKNKNKVIVQKLELELIRK